MDVSGNEHSDSLNMFPLRVAKSGDHNLPMVSLESLHMEASNYFCAFSYQ